MVNEPKAQELIEACLQSMRLRHLEQSQQLLKSLEALARRQPALQPWCGYLRGYLAFEIKRDWAEAERILTDLQPLQVVLYPAMLSAPLFFLAALATDYLSGARLDAKILTALIYQGLVNTAFGFVAWNTLLRKYGAVALHSFIFIMPISGVALGGLVLGEPITAKILIALALIVAGILVVHLKPRKEAPVYPIRKEI